MKEVSQGILFNLLTITKYSKHFAFSSQVMWRSQCTGVVSEHNCVGVHLFLIFIDAISAVALIYGQSFNEQPEVRLTVQR